MNFKLKRIDWYIIKQFLGTYVFAIILIISISVVFDINEKIDKFLKPDVPLQAIILDYYMNFIPYFANLFSPLFTFIAVIFFTSKLADNSEIIAMLASGMSFRRLMLPYAISAGIIATASFILSAFIIPPANSTRIDFQNKYIKNKKVEYARNIQIEVEPGIIAYFDRYDARPNMGYRFSLEHFEGKKLISDFPDRISQTFRLYYGCVYSDLYRSLSFFPQDQGGHGIEYRNRTGFKFLLYPVYDRHIDFCDQRLCKCDGRLLDSEYSLYVHCHLFVSEGTEINVLNLLLA